MNTRNDINEFWFIVKTLTQSPEVVNIDIKKITVLPRLSVSRLFGIQLFDGYILVCLLLRNYNKTNGFQTWFEQFGFQTEILS